MRLRPYAVIVGFFLVLCLITSGGNMAVAQQSNNNQGQLAMTPASVPSVVTASDADSRESFIKGLNLRVFEAAQGQIASCVGDEQCLKNANEIKAWLCAANACDVTDNSQSPMECFGGDLPDNSDTSKEQVNGLICSLIKSPSQDTRHAVIASFPSNEDNLVKNGAFLLALKGSADLCEQYIKNYVGAYGPKWNNEWYVDLSGCRILAHESTREQEEKDFFNWYGVTKGLAKCSEIKNSEMRNECYVPGATATLASYAK